MTKSPLITKLEKPAMTWPAACVPSLPCDRMRRVVAMLSDRRSIVAISRMVGKDEKSSGRWIHSATIRISTESAIEKARPMSIRKAGIGRNSTVRMKTMPIAKPTSRPFLATGSAVRVSAIAMSFQIRSGPRMRRCDQGRRPSLREGGRRRRRRSRLCCAAPLYTESARGAARCHQNTLSTGRPSAIEPA